MIKIQLIIGIGARRMDTSEEHVLISEKTTYFNAIRSESKSDVRRTASMGPGVSTSHFDVDDHHFASGTTSPLEYEAPEYFGERGRSGQLPRSASAMPGMGQERRDPLSRQQSTEDEGILHVRNLSMRDRGPSPAYTPRAESHEGTRRSSLRNPVYSGTQPTLSPIASVPHSRAPSERTDSTSTERRRQQMGHVARSGLAGESLPEGSSDPEDAETLLPTPVRPILEGAGHRHGSGEVRFATAVESAPEVDLGEPEHPQPHRARTGSIRTINSNFSASTTSLATTSTHEGRHHAEPHPVVAAIRTAANSPIHSANASPAPSIRGRASTDDMRRNSTSSSGHGEQQSSNASGNESSRRSSLGREVSRVPGPATAPNQEIRKGKRTKVGQGSTIVINKDMPGPSRPSESRHDSSNSQRSASGTPNPNDDERQHRHLKFSIANAFGAVKGRIASKSRSRADSRNPSRAPSRSVSRAPSFDDSNPGMNGGTTMSRQASGSGFARVNGLGSAVPSYLQEEERTNRFQGRQRVEDGSHSRGSGRSRSTDRTASPVGQRNGERSPSRNRGRHKGMKVLTGALEHEEEAEHLHNWKEFKKGA